MDHSKHSFSRIKSDARKSTRSTEGTASPPKEQPLTSHQTEVSPSLPEGHPDSSESQQLAIECYTSKEPTVMDLPTETTLEIGSARVDIMYNPPASKKQKSSAFGPSASTTVASSSSSKAFPEIPKTPILIDNIEYASRNDVFEGLIVNEYGKIDEQNEKNCFLMFDMVDKRMSKTITCSVQANLAKLWAVNKRRVSNNKSEITVVDGVQEEDKTLVRKRV
ncbi:hypothetical protein R1sor_014415 [Riccia sorocarpa]|uniref:Uncharacterized protein n=1 Tax=Riccia sorocarpa TaxID=122646 RepID=A0ABD3HDL5_9MARC